MKQKSCRFRGYLRVLAGVTENGRLLKQRPAGKLHKAPLYA